MRALIYDGHDVRFDRHYRDPQPGAGDALIRPTKIAVSSTDLQISQGLLAFEGVMGHEWVGVVETAPPDQSDLVGRRVVGSCTTECGDCDLCQRGLREHCRHRTIMGLRNRDGCLADRFAVPVAGLVEVPDGVDDDRAVFASTVAAALQVVRQLTIEGRPFITVLGDGPLGLLMAQVLGPHNATVRLIGRYTEKIGLCERWGIKHRHVDDIGRRADQDMVVDCTGRPEGFQLATLLVRPRGTIIVKTLLADWNMGRTGVDLTPLVLNELTVIGSQFGPLSEALGVIERAEVDVISLISRRMSLDDGASILTAAAQPGIIRVLVDV